MSDSTGNGTSPVQSDKPAKPNYAAYGCVMAAASMWGCIGIFNRHLSALGISPQAIVLLRNLGGMVILGLLFLVVDRSVFRIKLRHLPYFLGSGLIGILLFTLCYFRSQQVSSLAVAAILLYIAPTFVVIFSALIWKDKITKSKIAALVIAFLGCSFVTGIWSGGLRLTPEGLLVGLGSGLFYAMYSIFGRFALAHYPPFTVTFYTFLVAGIGSCFLAKPIEVVQIAANPSALLLVLGLTVFATALPYILYNKGLAKIDSGKASILASVEPLVAAIVGILAFGEPMTLWVVLGLVCILISVYILR